MRRPNSSRRSLSVIVAGAAFLTLGAIPVAAARVAAAAAARAVPPAAVRPVDTSHPSYVIGSGAPSSCTSAAVVAAVARGGIVTFNCGPRPVTITMTATAVVMNTSRRVVLDGRGLITLNGAGMHQILSMNTCNPAQGGVHGPDCYDEEWPQLIVQNLTFENGYSAARENTHTPFGGGGGGAIFDLGGQLAVINSRFTGNRCYQSGPDLGGGAIRALAQWQDDPVFISGDTFTGGSCSNGGALSSIGVSWVILNSVMTGNKAIGWGANPPDPGTPGGGNGGAIYADGNHYTVILVDTKISGNDAREGGGAIFFVSNNRTGMLTIRSGAFADNPSGVFWTRAYPGIYFHSRGRPHVIDSAIS